MTDREKVVNDLQDAVNDDWMWQHADFYARTMEKAIQLLKEPEAVEPKTGHWIYLQYCANEGVYCSECHTKIFDSYPMKKKLSQFCGHCGAKMERPVMWK